MELGSSNDVLIRIYVISININILTLLPYSIVRWRSMQALEISGDDWMPWKHSTTDVNAASLCAS